MLRTAKYLCAVGAVTLVAATASAQVTQVLPSGFDTREGNTRLGSPFGAPSTSVWHFVYDSSHFALQVPIIIQQIDFRADRAVMTWGATTFPQLEIVTASSTNDWSNAAYDPVLANNFSGDQVFFFTGALNATMGTGGTTPNPFGLAIPGQQVFVYDASQGRDLIIQVRNSSAHSSAHFPIDAHAGGGIMATRYGSTSNPNATTATTSNPETAPIVQLTLNPANGVVAEFDATPLVGFSPQMVQFNDLTVTSTPGGVTGWAWDFDSNGSVDSTAQNPAFTYTASGTYTVTLTVTDPVHGMVAEVKPNYITIDPPPVAALAAQPTIGAAPLTVQFTDTTFSVVDRLVRRDQTWAWDFENDGTVDSTVANPTFTYTAPGSYSIRLDVSNVGGSDTVTRMGYIDVVSGTANADSPEILEYQFNEHRGTAVANTASTEVAPSLGTVVASGWHADSGRRRFGGNEPGFGSLGFLATPLDHRVTTGWGLDITGSFTISYWHREQAVAGSTLAYSFGAGNGGTFRSFTGGVAGTSIMFRGSAIGDYTSATTVQGQFGVWQHIALVIDDAAGVAQWYIDGVADTNTLAFAPGTFAETQGTNFNVAWHQDNMLPYTQFYDMDDFRFYARALSAAEIMASMAQENPTTSTYDSACAGPGGNPLIGAVGVPRVPNPGFMLTLSSAEANVPATLAIGFQTHLGGVLPIPLGVLGATCNLSLLPETFVSTATGAGSVTFPAPIPGDASLRGAHIYAQYILLGSQGAVTSGLDINVQ